MTARDPTSHEQPADRQRNDTADANELPEYSPDALFRALRASEARWRSLVENTQDWVWEVDASGHYTYVCPCVSDMLGYEPDEVLGKTPFDFMPPEERERVLEHFNAALKQRAPLQGLENINQRKDGALVVLETNGVPFFDEQGNFAGYRGIDRDITERKRNETALRRKSEELEAIFSTTHILIAVLDTEFNFLRVNNSYAARVQKDAESLIGLNLFALFPHEENQRIFSQVVASGQPHSVAATPYEIPEQPEMGTTYWDWTLTPLKNEHDEVEGVILTLVDATERERQRRAAELAHRHAQVQLEMRVSERTAELEAFTYAVSHDLRAPLRAIEGFSMALQEDCTGALDDIGRNYLERIHRATQRMGEFIDSLLSLSMISRTHLRSRQVDLSALAHDLFDQLREQEPLRSVDIHIQSGLSAAGDPALLRLLLQNLLGNAWKFTAHTSGACILFRQELLKGHPVFAVRDNGIGFELDHAARLFTPFTRLHGSDEFEGNGIGLATVRRIVERHGGMVAAEGSPQQGATFYFTLGPAV